MFVTSSNQDNLPNTVMESIVCGVPYVGFSIGGIPDMIIHQYNGYLVQPFDIQDLVQGITWILEDAQRHQILCSNARLKAEKEYSLESQAIRYLELYQEIKGNH